MKFKCDNCEADLEIADAKKHVEATGHTMRNAIMELKPDNVGTGVAIKPAEAPKA